MNEIDSIKKKQISRSKIRFHHFAWYILSCLLWMLYHICQWFTDNKKMNGSQTRINFRLFFFVFIWSLQLNMKRQIFVYLSVPLMLCAILLIPVARYALLGIAAAVGLFVLWILLGWYLVTFVLPSRKLPSNGKAVFITGELCWSLRFMFIKQKSSLIISVTFDQEGETTDRMFRRNVWALISYRLTNNFCVRIMYWK